MGHEDYSDVPGTTIGNPSVELALMTEDQLYCRQMLSVWVGGDHRLDKIEPFGVGIAMRWSQDLSTFDFDRLTALVLLAHKYWVRVSIQSHAPRYIKIVCHRRKPDGDRIYERHPGLADLAAKALLLLKDGPALPSQ